MASVVSRRPAYVLRVAQRVLAYLSGTCNMKLTLGPRSEFPGEVICYTDASYAPFGRRSFGAAVVTLEGSPVAWKASRQSFVTLSVMEAELYAATQGCILLESVFSILDEVCPGRYSKVLAIDNTSAVAMCNGGHGSQRTRHLKIRAAYIRESVSSGCLKIRHTPGESQLADLATKLQPKLRLWRLLTLWGFVGDRLTEMLNAFKAKLLSIVVVLSAMLVPVTGAQTSEKKEPLATTGWEELTFLLVLSCVAVVGLWEACKAAYRTSKQWLKGSRRAKKLKKISTLAADAARREVASQAGMSLISERSSDLRFASSASSSRQESAAEESGLRRRQVASAATSPGRSQPDFVATTTPPRRRNRTEEEMLPSPGAQSSVSGGLEDLQERARVVRDVLKLLTCEELRAALRSQGVLTSGVKEDLVERLANFFSPTSRADLPTCRQLKFVLWLWREKALRQRCLLRWTDVFTKTSVSAWLYRWKDVPSI